MVPGRSWDSAHALKPRIVSMPKSDAYFLTKPGGSHDRAESKTAVNTTRRFEGQRRCNGCRGEWSVGSGGACRHQRAAQDWRAQHLHRPVGIDRRLELVGLERLPR